MDVFEAEKILLRLLQKESDELLLRLAIERRLDPLVERIAMTPEIVDLMKKAGWIEGGATPVGDDELCRAIGACISGIAGFFLCRNIPIDASWTECEQNPDFVRGFIIAYPPEAWGERLATFARARGVPPHLIDGMLVYTMFDTPTSVN